MNRSTLRWGFGYLTLVGVAFWASANWVVSSSSSPGSPVRIDPLVLDFGQYTDEEFVEHVFTLINDSSTPIDIISVKTSCGCTTLQATPKVLPPGEIVRLPVRVDTRRNQKIDSDVVVVLRNHAPLRAKVIGEARQSLPEALLFGKILRGSAQSRRFTYRSASGETNIGRVEFNEDLFDVEYDAQPTSELTEFIVTVRDSIPYGSFNSELVIFTNDPNRPRRSILIAGDVQGPVEAEPEQILVRKLLKEDDRHTINLQIYSPYNVPFEVTKILAHPSDFISVELPLVDSGLRVEIPVVVTGGFRGILEGTISLVTQAQQVEHRLEIPLYAMDDAIRAPTTAKGDPK